MTSLVHAPVMLTKYDKTTTITVLIDCDVAVQGCDHMESQLGVQWSGLQLIWSKNYYSQV